MKRLLFIVNPNAGRSQIKEKLTDILDVFTKAGYWIEIYITQKPGEATTVAKARGSFMDRIICSGGDGTLDEMLNGVMQLPAEKRPEIGYISAGTTNDFAHGLGLPADLIEAAKAAASEDLFAIDVGCINGSFFSYTVGFGVFTNVSYATDQDLKKVIGQNAYLIEGAKELANMKAHHLRVEADDEVYEGDYLLGMVSNSIQVAGITGVWGPDIQMDDGLFELNLLKDPETIPGWGDLLSKFLVTHEDSEFIIRKKASRFRFFSEEPLAWVKDGEYGGTWKEVEIGILPTAVRLARGKTKE